MGGEWAKRRAGGEWGTNRRRSVLPWWRCRAEAGPGPRVHQAAGLANSTSVTWLARLGSGRANCLAQAGGIAFLAFRHFSPAWQEEQAWRPFVPYAQHRCRKWGNMELSASGRPEKQLARSSGKICVGLCAVDFCKWRLLLAYCVHSRISGCFDRITFVHSLNAAA